MMRETKIIFNNINNLDEIVKELLKEASEFELLEDNFEIDLLEENYDEND